MQKDYKIMKFSVIVCTYNASIKDIKFTLDSIMKQDFSDYEIIIADDGSKRNHRDFYERYFKEKEFSCYKLQLNAENNGTVKNVLSGALCAEGKYIKSIGAGDALAEKNVLSKAYDIFEEKKAKILFSNIRAFGYKNGERRFYDKIKIPRWKGCWKSGISNEKVLENIIVFNDQISGATFFYERNYLIYLMNKMVEAKVVYMEDLSQYIVLLENEKIYYMDDVSILYEYGSGISTKSTKKNNTKMVTDKKTFLGYIYENYGKNPFVIRRKKLENCEEKRKSRIKKGLTKILCEPKWLIFRLSRR